MRNYLSICILFFSIIIVAQNKPKTNVSILSDTDDLLPITSNEPNLNDLLDIVPSQTTVIKLPNAGANVCEKLGLQSHFTFNKKVGFMVNSSEGNLVGYFYLNTKNGYSFLPHESLSEMAQGEGELNQIMSPFAEFFQYTKSSEGNYVMKMSSNSSSESNYDWMSKETSKKFFSTFKKTGKTRKIGGQNQFKSVEYIGKDDDGKTMYIYLAAANDILINTRKTHSLTGHWGLGYIASPSKRTYMITGIKGDDMGIFMTYIENTSRTFSGKDYKPMGDLVGQALKGKMPEIETTMAEAITQANAEKDPKLRQLMLDQIKQMGNLYKNTTSKSETFARTSDIKYMPLISAANDPKATADFYDMQITALQQSIRELELSLTEAQKNNNNKAIATYTCTKNCYITELNRLQKVKMEHVKMLQQFKNDEEKREQRINQLMQTQGTPKACECE